MAKGRELKRRIKTVENTRKITRTMELVATSRMKRAQDRVTAARPYARALGDVIAGLYSPDLADRFPLLRQPERTRKAAVILLTSNRGLCGGFNANLIREARAVLRRVRDQGTEIELRAPVFKVYGEELDFVFTELRKKGCRQLLIDGKKVDISEQVELDESSVRDIDAIVDRFVEVGGRGHVLDVGTGPAHIPIELCRRRPDVRVTAVDAAAAMLDRAAARVREAGLADRIRLVRADGKRLPFPDGSFDAVMSNSIVHHLPDPRRNGSRLEPHQTCCLNGEQGQIQIGIAGNESRFVFMIIL